MHIRDGAQQRVCPVLDVEARVQPGWFWSRVILSAPENQVLAGLSHGHAKRLLAALERQKAAALGRLNADLQADYDVLAPVW